MRTVRFAFAALATLMIFVGISSPASAQESHIQFDNSTIDVSGVDDRRGDAQIAADVFADMSRIERATASTCKTHSTTQTRGTRTVKRETKDCTKDNGGFSHSTRTETCTKSKAGNSCASVRVTNSHSVSAKGNVTDTVTTTRCTKAPGQKSDCTTDTTTASNNS